ncbi:DNA polymerase III subunit delta' C-terminal domain-containing protein [Blochmannia endosymbiont of Camponotus sp.]|uniref:DNA polymerase III subunit delta' C-terminal domain-containing protein n=1 Tax=Blochmannia endosymbiont of Camponotus sp. TaxID=700220 RepID=UPI002024C225|nr:DNA polymerase III subunit delta' C-terminal domain-containing protein [Blochmannia endosymbiont of Camponotus sp.]URJ31116.1 DNA polymerase III subunit delta' [Blochmannia endosymbiont of Camponotus sp.]
MKWYPWLNIIHSKILNSYRKNRGHHALLLNAKWDNGEDALIYAIVRWLSCSHPRETRHCNICYNCKLMNIGHYPDYYPINPDNNTQTIGVDIIRACINAIHHHSYRSQVKIIFIKYVEHLTDQSINVLLKTLDEPPINTYFFFQTRDYMKIPLTFLSRCMKWSITPPKESLGLQWLKQQQEGRVDDKSAQCALRLCNGAPIEAEAMFKLGMWKQRLELCKSIYCTIINKDFLKLVPFLNTCRKNTYLYWFITILVDALKWKQGINKRFIINLDQIELITIIADYRNVSSLSLQLQQWLSLLCYFQKFTSVDRELLLTYRLLNWKQDIVESCFHVWSI